MKERRNYTRNLKIFLIKIYIKTIYQKLWKYNISKLRVYKDMYSFKWFIRPEEKSKNNDLIFCLGKIEEGKKSKSKVSRNKEILKNGKYFFFNEQITEKISESKSLFILRTTKVDKHLAWLIKEEEKKNLNYQYQVWKRKNNKWVI